MQVIKKIPQLLLFFILITACSSSKQVTTKKRSSSRRTTVKKIVSKKNTTTVADKIIATANTYKGTPYKYGGTTKRGIDCSALVMNSFANNGISLPRTSYDQSNSGKNIPLKNVRKGDLLFFRTNPRKPNRISHVGLVTSVKNGVAYFIHASTKRGVIENNMSQNYYKKAFVKAKRVL